MKSVIKSGGCLLMVFLSLLTSCAPYTGPEHNAVREGETEVVFSLKLPGTARPAVRSLQPEDEEMVQTADVFVFDDGGVLVDVGYGHGITDVSSGNETARSFKVTLQIGNDRDVMVLINAREIVNDFYSGGVPLDGSVTMAEFREKLTVSLSSAKGWISDTADADYRPIPMWGIKENVDINGDTNLTGTRSIKVSRMIARVSVYLSDAVDPGEFTLTSVRVYNYNTSGSLIPDPDSGDWTGDEPYASTPTLPAEPGRVRGPLEYTNVTAGRTLEREIYLLETAKGVSYRNQDPGTDYMENICLVLGGHYEGSSDETFYRVDFARTDNGTVKYMDILRNHNYMVTIKGVSGPGKPGPDEAFNSYPDNIEAGIVKWNDMEMEDIWFDGQYYLSISPIQNELWAGASVSNKIKIKTDYPLWSYDVTDDPEPGEGDPVNIDWLDVTTHLAGFKYPGNPDGEYIEYDVKANLDGVNKTAYLHITAGRIITKAVINQTPWRIDRIWVTPTGGISPWGNDARDVMISGYFDDTEIRAWDVTNDLIIAEGTVPSNAATELDGGRTLTIPAYGWDPGDYTNQLERTIAFEYFHTEKGVWQLIRSEDQPGFFINVTGDHVQDVQIPGGGQSYEVRVWGCFPSVQLRSATNGTANLAAGTTISAQETDELAPATGTIKVPNNGSGSARTVHLQYSVDGGTTWITITYGSQPKGNVQLSGGRIVAINNVSTALKWAQAMGISTSYNLAFYYTSYGGNINNSTYTPNVNTGCRVYSEPGYPAGTWRLPTFAEFQQMYNNRTAIGNLGSYNYWTSTETTAISASAFNMASGGHSNGTKDYAQLAVRCVRAAD